MNHSESTTSPLLRVEGLVKHFPVKSGLFGRAGAKAVHAVDGLDFELRAGRTLALVGESGCGKSTVGRLVLRLIEATGGAVWFEGDDLMRLAPSAMRARRRRLQMIFQDPYASLNPRMTVEQTLREPLDLHGLATGRRRERAADLLDLVGLPASHLQRYPHEFSGGQRQRVGIARALAVEPRLIVCDEAVSALDVSVQAQVINLLQDLQRQLDLSYIFISHDLAVVQHIATDVAVMYLGKIVEMTDRTRLFNSPRHPYTQALLDSIPRPDPRMRRPRQLLQGDVPNAIDPPSGCRFHTRCPHVRPLCIEQAPVLDLGDGHAVACHFWREIAVTRQPLAPEPTVPARLERLQAAFRPTRLAATTA